MSWFRIFFKKYETTAKGKTDAIIEIQEKDFKAAYVKVSKMGKKKHMRIAMIAEVASHGGFPDKI